MKQYTLFIIFITSCLSLSAQLPISFTSDQGLSNTCIRTIMQDSYQNVWISTENGLNRYDGAKINVYRHQNGQDSSLLHDMVNCTLELSPGTILVGSELGVQSYSYTTDKFTTIPLIRNNGSLVKAHIISMTKAKTGEIYVCTAGYGVYKLNNNPADLKFNQITQLDTSSMILEILQDNAGRLWILQSDGSIYHCQENFSDKKQITKMWGIIHILQTENALYLATLSQGLWRFSESSEQFAPLINPGYIITSIRPGKPGQLLISTDGNGLNIYDESTNRLTPCNIRTYEYNLATSNVKDAIVDSFGNIWVGVYWKGVLVVPSNPTTFQYVGRRSVLKNTLGTNCVTAITDDRQGNLWVATDHCGMYHLSADGSKSTHFKPGEIPSMPGTVMSILQDKHGTLWIGSSWEGLYTMNKQTGQCTKPREIQDIRNAYSMAEDNFDRIWIGTMGNALYSYDINTKQLTHYYSVGGNQLQKPNGIVRNSYIRSLIIHNNKLYAATASGVETFNLSDKEITPADTFLTDRYIRDIKITPDSILWAATAVGFSSVNLTEKQIHSYTTADGLPINSTGSIEIAPNGNIWIATDNGLSCFNPKNKTFTNYHITDGLQGNEFSKHASHSLNGTLYFGGINGLTYFTPTSLDKNNENNSQKLQPHIVDLYINNKPVHAQDRSGRYKIATCWIPQAKQINLSHTDNTFGIELSTQTFTGSSTTYSFSINNGEWSTLAPGQNTLSFVNLAPGTYNISIKSISHDQTSPVKQLQVVIHPAWYASTPAKCTYFLLAIAMLFLIFLQIKQRYKSKQEFLKHKQTEELNEARIQFFMNISHEIRTPLTLILSPLIKLMKIDSDKIHTHNYALIYHNAQRILRLINQLMDARKIEKGQFRLNYSQVELVSFLNNLYELFDGAALSRRISFSFLHPMDTLLVYIDPQNFDKIVMNLLSNAFKFTPDGGKIVMELQEMPGQNKNEKEFALSITDNGVGILDAEKQNIFNRFYSGKYINGYIGTGIGLNLVKMLVQLHNGNITVSDNPEENGTRFTVRLPQALQLMQKATENTPITDSTPIDTNNTQTPNISEEIQTEENKKNTTKKPNIIIVDDEPDIRHYLNHELSPKFNVIEHTDGQQAWDFILKNPEKTDIIVTDIMMPVMDGIALCRLIKNNFNTNHIPVVMLTAKTDDTDRLEGLLVQADVYISKPFNINILQQTIDNLLKAHKRMKGKYQIVEKQDEKIDEIDLISPDERMMDRMMKVINQNISNPDLSVEFIADKIGISRVHLHRRLKNYTGLTPRDFVRNVRLKQAAKLLTGKDFDITDVSIATGFRSVSTFCTRFKTFYGMTPKEYAKQAHKKQKENQRQ